MRWPLVLGPPQGIFTVLQIHWESASGCFFTINESRFHHTQEDYERSVSSVGHLWMRPRHSQSPAHEEYIDSRLVGKGAAQSSLQRLFVCETPSRLVGKVRSLATASARRPCMVLEVIFVSVIHFDAPNRAGVRKRPSRVQRHFDVTQPKKKGERPRRMMDASLFSF